jgi:hypothetical protein
VYATPKRQPNAVQSGDIIVLLIFVFPSVVLVILVSLNVPLSTTLAKPALRLLRLSTRLHLQSTQSASKSHPSPQGSNIPTASYNRDTPPPHPSVLHRGIPNSLEEITAHSPLPPIPLQAPNALIRRLLARVEVLAVRLTIFLSTIHSPSTKGGYHRVGRYGARCRGRGRTFRISWPWDLPTRACRFRRACLWALCLQER